MSLSSLLLGNKASIDSELDSLFHVPVPKAAIPRQSKDNIVKKRKLEAEKEVSEKLPKRVKSTASKTASSSSKVNETEQPNSKPKGKVKKSVKTNKGKGKEIETDDQDDDEELENAYLKSKPAPASDSKDQESDSEEDGDLTKLVHESVKKANKKVSRIAKYVPEEETPELREQRTIFVGNLPLEVASKKPLKKQLQRHILSFLPTAKIESIRFRSIPFQTPTAKLPTSDDEGGGPKSKIQAQKKESRQHEKERASVWRSKLDEKDEETIKNDEKRFLNPAQKKRIAFINQEFHSTADTVNAYIVFAHAPNAEGRPANLPPPAPTLDPYEAVRLAAEKCEGTLFMERMLRVDLVGKKNAAGVDALKHSSTLGTDPRLSVFVGNLEFASKEEDLRIFFEGVISAEKGPPPLTSQEDLDTSEEGGVSTKKPAAWVTRVRIVRDKDTQLGKGFAYVQFADRECVDELLALEEDKLKFAKRKLRVQRCKTLPGAKQVVPSQNKSGTASIAVVVPKGDPALGERLAGLPKDERKQLKSSDADRVARRLAKKKARMGMKPAPGKVKSNGKSKERKRVRS
ncbi:hypothetical protein GALMADRAFT_56971 [Galerina marginata CBS 339.88]|uniref:Nucleolar protein 12 n=1 Tax=Galerina marginata (strain CBS 339.88) TaxID=685588 RepID=A0A067TSK9_GALM3|nr:hypothetical protein GALMADRAFT_56971 [Galerina marginata CBS 339.88]